jgi:hypothetical protein
MSPGKLLVAGAVIVLLFAAALGFAQRRDASSVGNPQDSGFGVITKIFPQRALEPGDLKQVDCFDQGDKRFVIPSTVGCAFQAADKVKRILVTWTGGGTVTVKLVRDTSLTQTYKSTDDPQDKDHPRDVVMPLFGDGTQVAMICTGASTCLVKLR